MSTVPLRWGPSAQGRCLIALAAVSTGFALALRRPDLLALATPALWSLLTTSGGAEPTEVTTDVGSGGVRVEEGQGCDVSITLTLDGEADLVSAQLALPTALSGAVEGMAVRARRLEVCGRPEAVRWGRHRLGPLRVDLLSASGLRAATVDLPVQLDCLVAPRPEPVAAASAPRLLPNRLGEHVTRVRGHGTEPIGVRAFAPGDPIRRVNWRVSSRRQELHVTMAAAERSVDLVVVIDALSDVGQPDTSLDRAVRTASGMASRWLRERDRVGLVVVGGALRWLTPASSRVQQQRIAEALLWAWSSPGEVPPDVDRVPRVVIPSGAVVVVLSPLLEERMLAAIAALRHRSSHLLLIDVLGDAVPDVGRKDVTGQLAARLWALERAATVERLRRLGTPVLQPRSGELDRLVALALRASR